jgi:predicted XRE-type DNA-binding protein
MKRTPSPQVTFKMACEIKYLKIMRGLYNHQIAALFGINQGRVSEVMTGKRHPEAPPIDYGTCSF